MIVKIYNKEIHEFGDKVKGMRNILDHFIRLRFAILIILLVIAGNTLLAIYNVKQFESFSTIELQHEGLLLSHALEAGISSSAEITDIEALQSRIDRFSAARQNDIEINIVLLEGTQSRIIVSNIYDNIEETSSEEHENLLKSIKNGKPVILICDKEDDVDEEDDVLIHENLNFSGKNNFDFLDDHRFLDITVPLIIDGKGLGSINAKLSLRELDEKISKFKLSIYLATIAEIFMVLVGLAILIRHMIGQQSNLLKEESARFEAELKVLQSQINPHFLFNTLNSLSGLIPENPDLAEDLTMELSDFFRKVLGASKKGSWQIKDEMDLVNHYLNIERFRLKDRLKYTLSVEETANPIRIPCLIIEPLVENAVKHGINSVVSGGKINIAITLSTQDLNISVEDVLTIDENYPASANTQGGQTGIENIKKRLKLVYGENASFTLKTSPEGAISTIKIKNIRNFQHG